MSTTVLRRTVLACVGAALLLAQALPATAQFPSRPLRAVVPAGAGGAADVLARVLADRLGTTLGQPVVVDNRPGAGGIIGSEAVARANADGHTLLVTSNTFIIAPSLYAKVPFDIDRDFAPVALLASTPNLLVIAADRGVRTLADLVALARKTGGGLDYGSPGVGTAAQLTVELIARSAGAPLNHVPFKSPQQAMVETLAGRIPVSISGVSNSLPHVKAGRIVPLLVTDARRHPLYPDVPSVTEAGIPEAALSVWFGVYSTGGTPGAILTRINAEINAALRQADVAAKLAAQGFDPMGGPASRLADLQRRERPIYAKVIRDAGMKVE